MLDSEYTQLEDNDCWMYQMEIERFIERMAPGMGGKYRYMVQALAAQARRNNAQAREDR